MSARKGNIARLDYDTREVVNRMIRDGRTVKQINAWLVKQRIPGAPFEGQNFTNWRKGGYKEWLEEEKRLDAVRKNAERIKRTVAAGGLEVYDELAWQTANAMHSIIAGTEDKKPSDETATFVAGTVAKLLKAQTERVRAEMAREQLRLAKEKHALDREKFEVQACTLFLKWSQEQRARDIADSGLTNEEKIKELRAEYFADVDALEASGEVVLPQ